LQRRHASCFIFDLDAGLYLSFCRIYKNPQTTHIYTRHCPLTTHIARARALHAAVYANDQNNPN
jgi:hypothetical protein